MEFQKKNRIMIWTITVLLIMNIATLALLWFSQFKKPKPFPPLGNQESLMEGVKFLERELNLSEIQIQQFIESRNKHAEKWREIQDKIHLLKTEILDEVFKPYPDSVKIRMLSNEIGQQQAEFEYDLFHHFSELNYYCRPEQQEKLKLFLNDIATMTRPPKPHTIYLKQQD